MLSRSGPPSWGFPMCFTLHVNLAFRLNKKWKKVGWRNPQKPEKPVFLGTVTRWTLEERTWLYPCAIHPFIWDQKHELIPKCDISQIHLWGWLLLKILRFFPTQNTPVLWVERCGTTFPGSQYLMIKPATCERPKFTFLLSLFYKSMNPYDTLLRETVLTSTLVDTLEVCFFFCRCLPENTLRKRQLDAGSIGYCTCLQT